MCDDPGIGHEQPAAGINNRVGLDRESEGVVVAMKRGNARGAKGPCRPNGFIRSEEIRLDNTSHYGRTRWPELGSANG